MISSRRSFLVGLGAALITAPAIVRAGSLMPVKYYGDRVIVADPMLTSPYSWYLLGSMVVTGVDLHGNVTTEIIPIENTWDEPIRGRTSFSRISGIEVVI